MLTTKLIDRDGVAMYRQVSKTVHNDVFNSILNQTQIEDIATLLGEELFNDLMANIGDYDDLLDGGAYTYNDITYQNYGLRSVIAYYVDARLKMFGNEIDTPFGLVNKLNSDGTSQPSNYKMKEAIYQANRQTAFTLWQSVENWLKRTNNQLYNNSNSCRVHERETNSTFKIRKIER